MTRHSTSNQPIGHDPERGAGKTVPAFSSEIDSAWSVVEAMRGKGWFFDAHVTTDKLLAYAACFWKPMAIEDDSLRVDAATAPLAICLAALAALSPAGKGKENTAGGGG